MNQLMSRIFGLRQGSANVGRPDPTDFDATLVAAREVSLHGDNRNDVIVIVEMGAEFNPNTGSYVRHRYNFYTYRGQKEFNQIANLKAAFVNGKRVDTIDRANSGRIASHVIPTTIYREISIADGDPLALGGRKPVAPDPIVTTDQAETPEETADVREITLVGVDPAVLLGQALEYANQSEPSTNNAIVPLVRRSYTVREAEGDLVAL